MRLYRIAALGCLLLWQGAALRAQSAPTPHLEVVVLDRTNTAVPGAHVEARVGQEVLASGETDLKGQLSLLPSRLGPYLVVATKDGFEPSQKEGVPSSGSPIEFTLAPATHREQLDVKGTLDPVEQGASTPNQIAPQLAKELPSRPATVADALPLIPGVVRTPTGDLQISGTGEHRSSLIVNSADVTDPATGQFGLTVPIDSVETLSVFQTPFLAEYGRFSAGLVSVETRRGGDTWKWEINDPLPDFRIRSWHLRGLRDASPRFNAEGPLIKGKLYFSEGLEYEVRNTEIHTLPFPFNQTKKAGVNSFAQFDWIASSKQLVTATVHIAPQRLGYVNLDAFNPQETVPDASTHNYTTTVADRWTVLGGLLDNTFSMTRFDARVWPQGPQDLTIAPARNSGNYFAQQDRDASRIGWAPTYSVTPVNGLGVHAFKLGAYFAHSSDNGQVTEHPINILDSTNTLLERIAFVGGHPFEMSDTEYAVFGQDHWSISSRLAADLGVRTESQVVSQSFRVAPRAGIAWVPFSNTGTVVRAGFGFFYDRVPLNVYAFNHYPRQLVTMFDPSGAAIGAPFLFLNSLGEANTRPPFVFHRDIAGNFSPRSATGSIQVEQNVGHSLKLRVGYMRSVSDGLVTMDVHAPDPETRLGAYELSGDGQSRYRQLEFTARVRVGEERQLFFSYVRNRAHGELNDFSSYLGSFPLSIIRPNQYGRLPGDLPNRFLTWGTVKLPRGFWIAPILEYRSGFPYAVTDAAQNYVGIPNHSRYPGFLSLDSRFSKDIKMNPKYTVRLSISGYNMSNHFNPEALHANIDDPSYGLYFGSRGRRFTADFDVLF